MLNRRLFLQALAGGVLSRPGSRDAGPVQTVTGPIPARQLGLTLVHEHILVDFVGANKIHPGRWDRSAVVARMRPYLDELVRNGVQTLVECTPSYLGKDPLLLKTLSEQTGLRLLTNTGYYGAVDNKYLPAHAHTETADQLADRWTAEYENGIGDTGIRPGFIKISVNPGPLSALHRKLVVAAARTHLRTGLTIYSHTGPFQPAFEQIAVLKEEGVRPEAFVWVHAQGQNMVHYARAAREGTWVSLDGLDDKNVEQYVATLRLMKENGLLNRTLLSHDGGWYDPGQPEGGPVSRRFTVIFDKLLPRLKQQGFTRKDLRQLLEINPAEALAISIRKR